VVCVLAKVEPSWARRSGAFRSGQVEYRPVALGRRTIEEIKTSDTTGGKSVERFNLRVMSGHGAKMVADRDCEGQERF
jgi:hypothetical protein